MVLAVGLLLRERLERNSIPEPNTGCILWEGKVDKDGYGAIKIERKYKRAHRVAWELEKGCTELCVLHKCDTKLCINTEHLFEGTRGDNRKDCVAKGRHNKINKLKGELAINAKLNESQVLHIKQRLMPAKEYAKLYSVSRSTISMIWTGRNWK